MTILQPQPRLAIPGGPSKEKGMDNINEMLNLAKQYQRQFRAFEKLDEFIKAAAALQGRVGDLEKKKIALTTEVEGLEQKAEELRNRCSTLQAAADQAEVEAATAQGKLNNIKVEMARIRKNMEGGSANAR
jgi:chromosome segregation ATPase